MPMPDAGPSYRQCNPPASTHRFVHVDTARLHVDAAIAGCVACTVLLLTLAAFPLAGLPRVDLPARLAVTFAGHSDVGLAATSLGWIACGIFGVFASLVYAHSLALAWPGTGAASGALHGALVWLGALSGLLLGGEPAHIEPGLVLATGAALLFYGVVMGTLLRGLIVRRVERELARAD